MVKLLLWTKIKKLTMIAIKFFEFSSYDHKIQTIIKPALESLSELKENDFDLNINDAEMWK